MKTKKNYNNSIVNFLKINDCATAKELASFLNVSERTIHNYIAEINFQDKIIESSTKGYTLIQNSEKYSSTGPTTQDERIFYIVLDMLKHGNTINCSELCKDLFISEATLQKDIFVLKNEMIKSNLQLKKKKGYLYIIGDEKDKRAFIRKAIMKNKNSSSFDGYFDYANITGSPNLTDEIRKIVLSALKENKLFINDYSLTNLILHLVITVSRLKNNNPILYTGFNDFSDFQKELQTSQSICNKITKQFNVEFSQEEIYQIAFLLITKTSNVNFYSMEKMDIASLIGTSYYQMADEIIKSVYKRFYLDIADEEFILKFSLHLKNAVFRASNNYSEKNQLFEKIKFSYPLVYDVAVFCAMEFKRMTGYYLNEDEISFIAIHIGSVIEQKNKLTNKIKCVLLYPKYYDYYRAIIVKLNNHFGEVIEIVSIVSIEEKIPNIDYDLVISAVDYSDENKKVVLINPFLTDTDIDNITKKIEQIHKSKSSAYNSNIMTYFSKDLFETEVYCDDPFEFISYMTDKVEKLGLVTENFKAAVIEREKNASTSFDNLVAIPHTVEVPAKKTFISIIINKNPTMWDNFDVNVIILIGLQTDSDIVFKDVYTNLLNIIDNKDNIKKIISCKTFEDFIDVISTSI